MTFYFLLFLVSKSFERAPVADVCALFGGTKRFGCLTIFCLRYFSPASFVIVLSALYNTKYVQARNNVQLQRPYTKLQSWKNDFFFRQATNDTAILSVIMSYIIYLNLVKLPKQNIHKYLHDSCSPELYHLFCVMFTWGTFLPGTVNYLFPRNPMHEFSWR